MPRIPSDATWGRLRADYEIGEVLGTGATGLVVAALRKSDGREVAIKTLLPSCAQHPDLGRRLEREAVAGRRIRHPGIVPVLDQGRFHEGSPYVVFGRLHGESLLSMLSRERRLGGLEAAWVTQRVARVLAAVHGAGYVHRDLKPEHVMLSRVEDRLSVYVIDFGVCQAPDADGEPGDDGRGKVFGTPGYLAPEQAAGDRVDARSDLYGLGATLFEMLMGRPPFAGKSAVQVLQRVLSEEPPRIDAGPAIPKALCQLVHSLLAREPDERPENARMLTRALAPLLSREEEAERGLLDKLRHDAASCPSTPTRRLAPLAVQRILSAQS